MIVSPESAELEHCWSSWACASPAERAALEPGYRYSMTRVDSIRQAARRDSGRRAPSGGHHLCEPPPQNGRQPHAPGTDLCPMRFSSPASRIGGVNVDSSLIHCLSVQGGVRPNGSSPIAARVVAAHTG